MRNDLLRLNVVKRIIIAQEQRQGRAEATRCDLGGVGENVPIRRAKEKA